MNQTRLSDSPLLLFGRAATLAAMHWPLAIVLWLPNVLLALVATIPLVGAAERLASSGPLAEQAASGAWAEVALELAFGLNADPARPGGEQSRPLVLSAALGAALAVSAVPLSGLVYTFLSGGVLERLSGGREPFVGACRHWFWPMLRLGCVVVVTFGVAAVIGVGAMLVIPGGNAFNDGLRALVFAGWLALVNGWLATARADMVVRGERRAFAALFRSTRAVLRPAELLLWLGVGLLSGLHASLQAGTVIGISAFTVVPAAMTFQVAALAGAWLKLLQLALGVEVARASAERGNIPPAQEHLGSGFAVGDL